MPAVQDSSLDLDLIDDRIIKVSSDFHDMACKDFPDRPRVLVEQVDRLREYVNRLVELSAVEQAGSSSNVAGPSS